MKTNTSTRPESVQMSVRDTLSLNARATVAVLAAFRYP